MSYSFQLATHIVNVPSGSVPEQAIQRAKQAFIDCIGCAIAGSGEPVSVKIVNILRKMDAKQDAAIIGADFKTTAAEAALANSIMAHALDFDDSAVALAMHPTTILSPALLALGQELKSSGHAVLEAYVIGLEAMIWIARNIQYEHYDQGWHPTATVGVFGVTAATARLLKLSIVETTMALGLAASMASGIKENFGSMGKPFQVGHAAHKGILCSLMASEGATSSVNAFEGKQGFFNVYNGDGRYRVKDLKDFGQPWGVISPGMIFKRYACCGNTHTPIDAALTLIKKEAIEPKDIDKVLVRILPRRIPHINRPCISNGLEGKFSLQYILALAFQDGKISISQFTDEMVGRYDIKQLMSKIKVEPLLGLDDAFSPACELEVTLKDGSKKPIRLEDAVGRRAEDFYQYMWEKFSDCTSHVFPQDRVKEVVKTLKNFEKKSDINKVMDVIC